MNPEENKRNMDKEFPSTFPPQQQPRQPGLQGLMEPEPVSDTPAYRGSGKLQGKVALITGGDSGIGRSVAVLFAKEGADVAIVYLDEHDDAAEARREVEQEGRRCITIAGDVGEAQFCRQAVERTVTELGGLNILVNNAAEQHVKGGLAEISDEQLARTFRTNLFSCFYLSRAALPHLKQGDAIINTASIQAYRGNPVLMDYASTKGAIVTFTRTLARELLPRGIRVNAVAPGPVWTPLIPATFADQTIEHFGSDSPLGRPAQPIELAPSYVFLAAASDSSYMTGQVLHVDAGMTTCT
jgi:NAD(P)-dependent dehydrogenase (short-subunit alcohol dehydrogenase family)